MLQQSISLAEKEPHPCLLHTPPSLLLLQLLLFSHPPALRAEPRPMQPWPTTSPHPLPRVLFQAPPYPQLSTRSPPARAPQVHPNGPRHLLLDACFPMLRSLKTNFW